MATRSPVYILLILALSVLTACSSDVVVETAEPVTDLDEQVEAPEPASEAQAEEPASESEEQALEQAGEAEEPAGVVDLEFVLPALPSAEELATDRPVGPPGNTIPTEVFTPDYWVWCGPLDLNPREDAPDADAISFFAGSTDFAAGSGGVYLHFDSAKFTAGDVVALPSESWDLVLFTAYVHDELNVPQEYNSDQEESTGTITFHEVPCQGNGDVLSFTVDGALGAETNPGYIAAVQVSGTFTGGLTEPNPAFAE